MSTRTRRTRAAEIHDQLGHPIVDADGHLLEFLPTLHDYVRQELGGSSFDRYMAGFDARAFKPITLEERRAFHRHQGTWFGMPSAAEPLDLATGFLPKLLASRMDDLGLDFTILYGTYALRFPFIDEEDIRRAACRAANRYAADFFGEYADRMAVAAFIPMHTPAEAIEELEYVKSLGFRVIAMPPGVYRRIPAYAERYAELFPRLHWWDTFGLDSEYDYDPVWAKCQELGFAVTFHGGAAFGTSLLTSRSISTSVYNHIGSHALLMHQVCKSLFLGGVTRRFPNLTFGFLECGAAWACQLLANFEEYWEKRNAEEMAKRDPARLDRERFAALLAEWGGKLTEGRSADGWYAEMVANWPDQPPAERDEWARAGITREEDIRDRFVPNFYFGCEADDPSAAWAFSPANAFGAELQSVLSSDIGHWDVVDTEDVLPDSHRFVEKGLMTPEQYRRFTFEYPALLHLRMNPNFFVGTRVESAARELLAKQRA